MAVPAVSRLAHLLALHPIRINAVHRPTQAAPPARREAGAPFQMSKSKRLLVKAAIFSSGSCLRSSIPHGPRLVLGNLPQKILQFDLFGVFYGAGDRGCQSGCSRPASRRRASSLFNRSIFPSLSGARERVQQLPSANALLTFGRCAREDSREFEARNWRGLETAPLTVMEIMSRIHS